MSYVDQVLASVKEKNAHEPEFLQTTTEVLNSLRGVLERHPEYQKEDPEFDAWCDRMIDIYRRAMQEASQIKL